MALADIITQAIYAISVISLVALGLGIIFGMMGVINLAHGAFITVGAYVAFTATSQLGSLWAGLVAAVIVGALIGALIERSLVRYLYHRPLDTLLATWGVSIVLTELIKLIYGTGMKNVDQPLKGSMTFLSLSMANYRVFATVLSLSVIALTYLVFTKTSFGIKARAVIQNDEMAGILGINVNRVYLITFMFGSSIAALAGAILAPTIAVMPQAGSNYLVRSFFVVIVGGVGKLFAGAIAGSTLIEGVSTGFSFYSNQLFAQTIVFFLAIIVIRFRPQGVFPEE